MVIHKMSNAAEPSGRPWLSSLPAGGPPLGPPCSPSSAAGHAPPGRRSWWPWSCAAPPPCCTAWPSGSRSPPAAPPAPSPTGTAPLPGWGTGPGRGPPRSPPLSGKQGHGDKASQFPGKRGQWRPQASRGRVSTEGGFHGHFTVGDPPVTLSPFSEEALSQPGSWSVFPGSLPS